jgi:hypothetical protein
MPLTAILAIGDPASTLTIPTVGRLSVPDEAGGWAESVAALLDRHGLYLADLWQPTNTRSEQGVEFAGAVEPTPSPDQLTEVERAIIRNAVADHGAEYYGCHGWITFTRGDAIRYTTEGFADPAIRDHRRKRKVPAMPDHRQVWAAVEAEFDAHPDILSNGRLTAQQLARQQSARIEEADRLWSQAGEAFTSRRYVQALQHLCDGELTAPQHAPRYRPWRGWRSRVQDAALSSALAEGAEQENEDRS